MAEAAEKLPEEVVVTLLPPEAVLGLRKPLAALLERDIANAVIHLETVDDVFEQALDGRVLVWMAHRGNEILGLITTMIADYPRARLMRSTHVAGKDVRSWIKPMIEAISECARANGCQGLMAGSARKGWTRLVAPLGFEPVSTVYFAALED